MFSTPKDSLLTGLNKLKTTQPTYIFWNNLLMQVKTHKIMQDANMFDIKLENVDQTENIKHPLL